MQRAEQPQSLIYHWLRLASSGGRVVMLAGQGLADPQRPQRWLIDKPPSLDEAWRLLSPLQAEALRLVEKPTRLARLVAGLLRRGLLSRLLYFGVDGVSARLAGRSRVLEVYGSVLRARCPRCGKRIDLNKVAEEPPRCPRCGTKMEPDLVWKGMRPRHRVLGEAVYEATTADLLITCCLGGETLPAILALSARRFTKLALLGDDYILVNAADYRVPTDEIGVLLEEIMDKSSGGAARE